MRFDSDTIGEIQDALLRNKRRTFLTGFGVFWGIFMLLFLLGGGNGLKDLLVTNFDGFATNTIVTASGETSKLYKGMKKGRRWNFRTKDVERLHNMIPELDLVTPQIGIWGQTALNGTNSTSVNVKGVVAEHSLIEEPKLKYGRHINSVDVAAERKVCVIGKRVYTSLFPDGGDPCGTFIKVGPVYYNIVGVDFAAGNVNINGRTDMSVVIPLPVAQKVYHRGDRIDVISMTAKPGISASLLEPRIRQVIAREHLFDPTDQRALFLMNTEQIFNIVNNLFIGVNFLILLVGLGTLLAGIIGVSNIMMVNVKSRTIEIGIRRAIGATPADILSQILLESITLTTVAGSLGVLFSTGLLNVMESVSGKPFQISFGVAVGAMILVLALGVIAGFAPAMRAMKIKPVEAMRDE